MVSPIPVHEMYAAFTRSCAAPPGYLHEPVTKAVLTVPAYFSDGQRQALKEAARLAGLEVIRILAGRSPRRWLTASAAARSKRSGSRCTTWAAERSTSPCCAAAGLRGPRHRRGWLLRRRRFRPPAARLPDFRLRQDHKIDLRQDRTALQRLRDAVEKAKIDLSSALETMLEVPFIISTGTSEPLHLRRTLTRVKLEELTEDLIDRTLQICRSALAEVGVECHEVETVILVGGMTRMPRVQQAVTELFGRPPVSGLHNEDVIAIGAALQGAALLTATPSSPPTTPVRMPWGCSWPAASCSLVEPGATLPTENRYVFTTTRDDQTGLKLLVVEGKGGGALPAGAERALGEFIIDGLRAARAARSRSRLAFPSPRPDSLRSPPPTWSPASRARSPHNPRLAADPRDVKQAAATAGTYALELQRDDEYFRAQQRTERLIGEILQLLPRAEHAVGGSELGQDAMRRARAAVGARQIAIIRSERSRSPTLQSSGAHRDVLRCDEPCAPAETALATSAPGATRRAGGFAATPCRAS